MIKRYDSYKESGIEWIGEVPEHWGQLKLKYLARVQPSNVDKKAYDNEQPTLLCNYVDVYKNEFIVVNMDFMKATATPAEIEKFRVDEGDVLVTKDSESADDIAVPAYVKDRLEGVTCGYHLTQIKPNKENLLGGYLFRLFQTPRYNNQFKVFANGVTRYGLSIYYFENAMIPLPSIVEQKAIADFLNDKTSQIDSLIQKKRQMIVLLEEEKISVINEAVTKGVNPDITMKDSGIEWLGMVPAHWDIKKLKWVANRITDGAHISPDTSSADFPFVSTVDIKGGRIDFEKCLKTSTVNYEYLVKTGCQPKMGDVLYSKDGTIGRTALIDFEKEFVVASSLIIITPNQELISPVFLEFALQSSLVTNYVEAVISGSALRRISINKVSNSIIAVPPVKEQLSIVSYLNEELDKKCTVIERIKVEVNLLEEYRTALISEAVTGKIDVRDYQPELITSPALA